MEFINRETIKGSRRYDFECAIDLCGLRLVGNYLHQVLLSVRIVYSSLASYMIKVDRELDSVTIFNSSNMYMHMHGIQK